MNTQYIHARLAAQAAGEPHSERISLWKPQRQALAAGESNPMEIRNAGESKPAARHIALAESHAVIAPLNT